MSKRLHSEIVERLEGLPDEILALESAMEEFGESFGLGDVVELAESGSRLAQLELPKTHEASSSRAFDALKEAGVIDASLCRNLRRVQKARSDVEHDYPGMRAGRLHVAVELGLPAARELIGPYSSWIAPYLA